jgi:RNA polymerase sigma-70 factor (ECF subfamily)
MALEQQSTAVASPAMLVLGAASVTAHAEPEPSAVDPSSLDGVARRAASGDHAAMADLYDATSARVFGLAMRIVGEPSAAEDVVSDVYLQAWRQAGGFDPRRGSVLAWLLTLTRTRSIDALRARQRRRAATEQAEAAPSAAVPISDLAELTIEAERQRSVHGALVRLTPEQRQVIELAYFGGLSHSEIAARLGQPLGTVKTRIRAAMLRLRDLLAPLHGPISALKEGAS